MENESQKDVYRIVLQIGRPMYFLHKYLSSRHKLRGQSYFVYFFIYCPYRAYYNSQFIHRNMHIIRCNSNRSFRRLLHVSTSRCHPQGFTSTMEYKRNILTLRRLTSYIYMEHPFLMFLDHTRRRSTVGRTPLDE